MTCCFQGQYHGNAEEDSKLDLAFQRRRGAEKMRPLTRRGEWGADIILPLTGERERGPRGKGTKFSRLRCCLHSFKQSTGLDRDYRSVLHLAVPVFLHMCVILLGFITAETGLYCTTPSV